MIGIRQIAEEIVAREGGYVDDPDDPGGATKYGVTIGTLRRLGIDLDRDGDVDVADLSRLSRDQVTDIFIKHYFDGPGLGALPACLQASVFDMQVNAGSEAVRLLQKLLIEMGYKIAVDGIAGPQTAAAAQDAAEPDGAILRDAYAIERRNYYFRLADRRPASRKFARTRAGGKGGWIRRAEEFMSPHYHMTQAEFRDRVSAWD